MHRAMRLMDERINDVQLFLEMRDARLPFSSKNYHFDTMLEKH
jgi:ribosome biogenesis GTPase A